MNSLLPEILTIVAQYITDISVPLQCLNSKAKAGVLPYIQRLQLTSALKLSQILTLFEECSHTPLLSGTVIVDLPVEVVPWASIYYEHLTLCFSDQALLVGDAEFLLPLFSMAYKDHRKTLKIYDYAYSLVGEAMKGYVSQYLVCRKENRIGIRESFGYYLPFDSIGIRVSSFFPPQTTITTRM